MTKLDRRASWEIAGPDDPDDGDDRGAEISALCIRHTPPGEPDKLLAVGDEFRGVGAFTLAPPPQPIKPTWPPVDGLPTGEKSEFEGIASDGVDAGGRVFVLREGPACVLVLDHAAVVLEHTIKLSGASKHPDIGGAGWVDKNARGEGLLLLRDGHMLIAKQHAPARLIEFGPSGASPLGYTPGRALAAGESFALADGDASKLEVLATWWLRTTPNVESINDLAIGPDGHVYFISSASRCIGRLEADLTPWRNEVAASALPLPSELFENKQAKTERKAEGLAFSEKLGWLVALDLKRDAQNPQENLHQLVVVPG